MSFLNRTVAWSIIIKNIVIIGGIAVAVFFLGLSLYANFVEDRPVDAGLPKPPSINQAAWQLTIRNTGNIIYTNSCEHPSDNIFILHGYYEIKDGKYRKHDNDLMLDKKYFGDIILKKR